MCIRDSAGIGPDEMLVFKVKLIDIVKPADQAAATAKAQPVK